MLRHVVDVPLYAAIGVGPLVAGRTVIDGFIGVQGEPWLGRTSLTIEWLAFVVLGYFFTRTLIGLSLDYETFWRVPGRVSQFAALLAAESPDGPLHAHVERARGDIAAALHARTLSRAGIGGASLGPLQALYTAFRAGWLGARRRARVPGRRARAPRGERGTMESCSSGFLPRSRRRWWSSRRWEA